MSWRVLFIDDEPAVLQGLKQRLRRYRQLWDMHFVEGGEQALAALAEQPFDVVVSDMRMPGMDGATLLRKVQELYPQVVRIVLSGHAEQESAIRAVAVTHQFLNKPCDAGVLENVIDRAASLHARVQNPALLSTIGTIQRLPAIPRVYVALTRALEDERSTLNDVAGILQEDLALCTKLLQIVNSAYFRLSRRIAKVEEAVAYLGLHTIQKLALAAEVFGQVTDLGAEDQQLRARLQDRSLLVAAIAQQLLTDPGQQDDAFVAGLLHDVGWLILVAQLPDKLAALRADLATHGGPLHEIEVQRLGVTHAELGGYLLGIWGLPYSVVEVAFAHHAPWEVRQMGMDILAAVYIAESLASEHVPALFAGADEAPLREDYLRQLGQADRLATWRAKAEAQAKQRRAHG
ncbi:MAG: response regulator [Pseudomonadota bacterium]